MRPRRPRRQQLGPLRSGHLLREQGHVLRVSTRPATASPEGSRARSSKSNARRSSSSTSGGSPPFGSLQLAYQEGSARFDYELVNYRTLFTKLSWVSEPAHRSSFSRGAQAWTAGFQPAQRARGPRSRVEPTNEEAGATASERRRRGLSGVPDQRRLRTFTRRAPVRGESELPSSTPSTPEEFPSPPAAPRGCRPPGSPGRTPRSTARPAASPRAGHPQSARRNLRVRQCGEPVHRERAGAFGDQPARRYPSVRGWTASGRFAVVLISGSDPGPLHRNDRPRTLVTPAPRPA